MLLNINGISFLLANMQNIPIEEIENGLHTLIKEDPKAIHRIAKLIHELIDMRNEIKEDIKSLKEFVVLKGAKDE